MRATFLPRWSAAMSAQINTAENAVAFAKTRDGLTLPVIDVTRPPFAVPDDPASLRALRDSFLEWLRQQQRIPRFLGKLLMRLATRRSRLLRVIFDSDQGYLDSITTYVMKL